MTTKYNIALYDITNNLIESCEICDVNNAEKIFSAKNIKTGDTSFFSVCKDCGKDLAIQYAHQNTYTEENLLFIGFIKDYQFISNLDAEVERDIFGIRQESV